MPIQVGNADNAIRRMLAGKPVIVAGDGSSLWTLTRSADLARAFVGLLGNPKALDEDFQITTDRGFTWNQIHAAIARGFGVEAIHAHVPTATLVACNKAWEGPLMGDKSWSALFDNTKVKGVVGAFDASEDLDEILQRLHRPRQGTPEESALAGRSRGGCADRPHHRRAGRGRLLILAGQASGEAWPRFWGSPNCSSCSWRSPA